jgi:hypothetical protein
MRIDLEISFKAIMEDFLKQINLYYPISEVTSKALLGFVE